MAFGSIPAAHILLPSMKQKPAPRRADEPKKYIERSKQVPARQSGGFVWIEEHRQTVASMPSIRPVRFVVALDCGTGCGVGLYSADARQR